MVNDPFDLWRFLAAQESVYEAALAELRAGRKQTHWMWFIFPQLEGLGRSSTAQFYGISGREEGLAYLGHAVLGARLVECTYAVNSGRHASADAVFGQVDALKFRSCMTLFAAIGGSDGEPCFAEALQSFYQGEPDAATLRLLENSSRA